MRSAERASVAILAMAMALALALGCGSPTDATRSNFQRALDAHFQRHCVGVKVTLPAYLPPTEGLDERRRAARARGYATELARLDALISTGLVSVRDGAQEVRSPLTGKLVNVPARVYELTEKGRPLYTEERSLLAGTVGTLCAATLAVDRVEGFSEPAPMFGYKMTRVSYLYSAGPVKDWARDPGVQASYPELLELLERNRLGLAALVLTDRGWVHEKDLGEPR